MSQLQYSRFSETLKGSKEGVHGLGAPVENGAKDGLHPLVAFTMVLLAFNPVILCERSPLLPNPSYAILHGLMLDGNSRCDALAFKALESDEQQRKSTHIRDRRHISEFQIGEEVKGIVKHIVHFGAFVDIGASKDGLIHNTQMSGKSLSYPCEQLKKGDIINCHIKEIRLDKEQITLSCKKFDSGPKSRRLPLEELQIGQKFDGTVTNVVEFGAFVDIGAVKDGLMHISQISNQRGESAFGKFQPGQTIKCRIIEIKFDKGQISLASDVAVLGESIWIAPEPETFGGCGAVVWLHHYDGSPEFWVSQLAPLRKIKSEFSWIWVHLRAPLMKQPFLDGKKRPSWGQFFDPECMHVGSRDYEDPDTAGWYTACVDAIKEEVEALRFVGVPPENIIIAGYSQGAAVALETVLSMQWPVGGCIALSGWLTPRAREALSSKTHPNVPILLCHGTEDDFVGFDCAQTAAEAFAAAGLQFQFEQYEGVGHYCVAEELVEIAKFLRLI